MEEKILGIVFFVIAALVLFNIAVQDLKLNPFFAISFLDESGIGNEYAGAYGGKSPEEFETIGKFIVSQTSAAVESGNSTEFSVALNEPMGGNVSFNCSNLPAGVSCNFNPSTCSGTCSSSLKIIVDKSAVAGDYSITVNGMKPWKTESFSFSLKVTTVKVQDCVSYCENDIYYSQGKFNSQTSKCEFQNKKCEFGCDAKNATCSDKKKDSEKIKPCGDGICVADETYNLCPKDCGVSCGNKFCEQGESLKCPFDCTPVCGDNFCEILKDETIDSCPKDCKPVCGDALCEKTETSKNCPLDCAAS